jgi:chromosome segregation and condensation protein ScpB
VKPLLFALAAVVLVSCDKPADVSHLDAAPVLRENAELKKKVAALEKEKEEMGKELIHAKRVQESMAKTAAKDWIEKDKLERAAARESN